METTITRHATKEEAEAKGKLLVEMMGRAYNPSFMVYQSGEEWVLRFSNWTSCD